MPSSGSRAGVQRRTDARRNRETILREADRAFAGAAEDVMMEDVARRAGLGRATVYRHFPDRSTLALAVVAHQMDVLRGSAAAREGATGSFRDLLQELFLSQAMRRTLVSAMLRLPREMHARQAGYIIRILTPAFEQAQAAGEIRPDAVPADLVMLLEMMEAAHTSLLKGPGHEQRVARMMQVLLDGLFVRP